jgi:anti-sigma factor RsiW
MRCNHLINDFLMDYLDGTLPEAERLSFEHHLSLCRSCRCYIDSYRKTIETAKQCMDCPKTELPPPPEELVKAILASVPKVTN